MTEKKAPKARAFQASRWTAKQTAAAGAVEGVRLSRSTEALMSQARREGVSGDETVARLRRHFAVKK